MIDNYIVIERLSHGGIRITTESAKELYIGFSLKDAEAKFREEHGLKGKRLNRIIPARD